MLLHGLHGSRIALLVKENHVLAVHFDPGAAVHSQNLRTSAEVEA